MKAAVVRGSGSPQFADFEEPAVTDGAVVVDVAAAALTQLTRARAGGVHYSATARFPFVAGVDGVGRIGERRVYFLMPEAPFGGLAERAAVRADRLVDIPEGVDDVTAAALANAGMSGWAALTERARIAPGDVVLVNGATGVSGRLAVRIAKLLGAAYVVATGRNEHVLEALRADGADATISLSAPGDEQRAAFARAFESGVDIVLDYLWGTSAEAILAAAASARDPARTVRFVNIGTISAPTLPLGGGLLRSTAVTLMGSGLGSVPLPRLLASIAGVYEAAARGALGIDTTTAPLADVETRWNGDGAERLVFVTR